jgi:hypothetical protein
VAKNSNTIDEEEDMDELLNVVLWMTANKGREFLD